MMKMIENGKIQSINDKLLELCGRPDTVKKGSRIDEGLNGGDLGFQGIKSAKSEFHRYYIKIYMIMFIYLSIYIYYHYYIYILMYLWLVYHMVVSCHWLDWNQLIIVSFTVHSSLNSISIYIIQKYEFKYYIIKKIL